MRGFFYAYTPSKINRTAGSSTYFRRSVGKKTIDKFHYITYICTKIMDIMITKQKVITAFTYICILFLGFALGSLITDKAEEHVKSINKTNVRVETMMLRP